MHSHLLLMTLFAFFVSLVFSVIAKDDIREQARFGGPCSPASSSSPSSSAG
jgi:hypothetical protein